MKKGLLLALAFGSMITFNSCTPESKVTGKWSFNTLKGEYAELWMDDQSLLIIRPGGPGVPSPNVYDYLLKGDTVVIYNYGSGGDKKHEGTRFYIEQYANDNLQILQDTVHNSLSLISKDVETIHNTQEFRENVTDEYISRIQSK